VGLAAGQAQAFDLPVALIEQNEIDSLIKNGLKEYCSALIKLQPLFLLHTLKLFV